MIKLPDYLFKIDKLFPFFVATIFAMPIHVGYNQTISRFSSAEQTPPTVAILSYSLGSLPAVKFTPKPLPSFDADVLVPLRAEQQQAALVARNDQIKADCDAQGGYLLDMVCQLPAPPPPAPTTAPAAVYGGSTGGNLGNWLMQLRQCESGGNYAENTGNGFYGAYQFTIDTWNHWQTGYARADLAPASVQDATIIENTKASSGGLASQNPGCYRSRGLSAFPPS